MTFCSALVKHLNGITDICPSYSKTILAVLALLPTLQQNHLGSACVAAHPTAKPFWRCLRCSQPYSKTILAVPVFCPSYSKTILVVPVLRPILQQNHSVRPVLLPILEQNHFVVACVAANLTAKPFWRCLCCCQSYSRTILAMSVLLPILQQNHSGDTCVALGVSFPLFGTSWSFSLLTFAEKTNGFQFKTR